MATETVENLPTNIPKGFTADEWNSLSEEEREGLSSIDKEEADLDTLKEIVKEEEQEEDAEEQAEEGEPKEEQKEEEVKEEAEVKTEEPVSDADFFKALPQNDQDLLAYRPVVKVEIPEEVPQELQTKLDALDDKFDAGDIERREYNRQRDAIQREITRAQINAADEMRSAKEWQAEQDAFLAVHGEYAQAGVRGRALYGALNETVIEIAKDPKNAHLSGMQVLLKAHAEVQKAFAPAPKVEEKKTEEKKPERRPDAKKPDIKTLADIPPSAKNDTGEDPFAAIDKLNGEALENALERMSEEQRKAYRARV